MKIYEFTIVIWTKLIQRGSKRVSSISSALHVLKKKYFVSDGQVLLVRYLLIVDFISKFD